MKDLIEEYFPNEEKNKQKRECVICEKPVNFVKFDSNLSLEIYHKEHLCKDCQIDIFGRDYIGYFFHEKQGE